MASAVKTTSPTDHKKEEEAVYYQRTKRGKDTADVYALGCGEEPKTTQARENLKMSQLMYMMGPDSRMTRADMHASLTEAIADDDGTPNLAKSRTNRLFADMAKELPSLIQLSLTKRWIVVVPKKDP